MKVTSLIEKAARRYQLSLDKQMAEKKTESTRVITISRMYGAGGSSISNILGERLGIQVWDRQILDVLAAQSESEVMFDMLDEKRKGVIESFLASLGGNMDRQAYVYLLPRAIKVIAQSDCIIVGRGAHFFLPDSCKILLKASFERRVSNVMELLCLDRDEARILVDKREVERRSFLDELLERFGDQRKLQSRRLQYDVEINTDRLDFNKAAGIILASL